MYQRYSKKQRYLRVRDKNTGLYMVNPRLWDNNGRLYTSLSAVKNSLSEALRYGQFGVKVQPSYRSVKWEETLRSIPSHWEIVEFELTETGIVPFD